jgi:hypothetical protein
MTGRLARIIDRGRFLTETPDLGERAMNQLQAREFASLDRRRHLASSAITACTFSALLVCAVHRGTVHRSADRARPARADRRTCSRSPWSRIIVRSRVLPARGAPGHDDDPHTASRRGGASDNRPMRTTLFVLVAALPIAWNVHWRRNRPRRSHEAPKLMVALSAANLRSSPSGCQVLAPARAANDDGILRGRGLQIVDAQGRVRASLSVLPPTGAEAETVLLRLITERGHRRQARRIGAGVRHEPRRPDRDVQYLRRDRGGQRTTSIRLRDEDGKDRLLRP